MNEQPCARCGQPVAADDETAVRRRIYVAHGEGLCPKPVGEDED